MDNPMKSLIVVLLMFSGVAHAAVFKCVSDGKVSYQDHPCDKASETIKLPIGPAESAMAGCYEVDFYAEAGTQTERYQLKGIGNDEFKLDSVGGKEKTSLSMKKATSEEMKSVGASFHLDIKEGVSMKWEKGTPNQKPVGLYKGVDAEKKNVILVFFFLSNGLGRIVPCPDR
jgi:Domain of unknown function (DUF4124)